MAPWALKKHINDDHVMDIESCNDEEGKISKIIAKSVIYDGLLKKDFVLAIFTV